MSALIQIAPENASIVLAKLQNPIKQSFEAANSGLKEVHKALADYSKALDKVCALISSTNAAQAYSPLKKFKDKSVPSPDAHPLSSQEELVNRAVGMHFLRDGQFSVASTFFRESSATANLVSSIDGPQLAGHLSRLRSENLQEQFADMYYILDEMRNNRNLAPATKWARSNSAALEARGSNLEFELGRLQFVWLFLSGQRPFNGLSLAERQMVALDFARKEFGSFQDRYLQEIQQLIGAMAFCPNLEQSPYKPIFYSDGAWENLAMTFTREFCSLLGLSADSPMYIAATAGAIALPTLQKLRVIMETKRTEWTTENELPVSLNA